MPQDYTDKIEGLLVKNNNYISELGMIYRNIDAEITNSADTPETIDMVMINSLQSDAKAIDKKIKDNIVTMNDLLARNILDYAYYQEQANNFLKRVTHIGNTIPAIFASGTTLVADVTFKNMGLFFSWTEEKGITLEVMLMDGDNNQISVNNFLFDVNLLGNEPGAETENGDYLKDKLFPITIDVLPVPPGEYIFVLTVKDAMYRFYDSFKVTVTMT